MAVQLEITVDLNSFPPCRPQEAVIEGADSEAERGFADFYRALHQCDFASVRGLLTEAAAVEWDALSEGRRAAMTARWAPHIAIVDAQAAGDAINVLIQTVPSNGTTTGILMERENGQWRLAEPGL